MTPLETFRIVATEFNDVPSEEVEQWMEICKPYISEKVFGHFYNQALAYYTAHKMKFSGLGDNSLGVGTIGDSLRLGSVSEGETSVSFGNNASTAMSPDGEFSLTPYGISFLSIRRLVVVPVRISGEDRLV